MKAAVSATALLISGTVGVGKSSTAEAIGQELTQQEVPHAVIDLDDIRRSWPVPPDDPFNQQVELRNLTGLVANFVAAGAELIILAGVVESSADRLRYAAAVGMPLTVCRLVLDLPTIRGRLTTRHADSVPARDWHLDRSGVLDAILDAAEVEDVVVDVRGLTPPQVAHAVLAAVTGVGSTG
jgi:adenylylsulfate kinase